MDFEHQSKTVALKPCTVCHAGLLEQDNFCRWCGVPQPLQAPETVAVFGETTRLTTSSLLDARRADVYRRVSGPLVNAVVTGALAAPSNVSVSPMVKRAILALISIPIWMIIVLLSPIDAYAAVKTLARQA